MSYFIILKGGEIDFPENEQLSLLPINEAPKYIVELSDKLSDLDGEPLYFVSDNTTGTSDEIVMEAKYLLWENQPIEHTICFKLIKACFENKWSIRIWLAQTGRNDYVKNSTKVNTFDDAINVLKNESGINWHA